MKRNKALALLLSLALAAVGFAGCADSGTPGTAAPESDTGGAASGENGNGDVSEPAPQGAANLKIAYLTENLGDNASNDDAHSGVVRYAEDYGVDIIVVETKELQDYDINARNFASEGYDLILFSTPTTSEIVATLAPDYPGTHFLISEGTVDDQPNVSCWQTRTAEAAFLAGAFSVLMNEELGGPAKAAFVGGVRNPALERAQFGYAAGADYVGGECTAVYVGNFTDVAKGKEIAMQLYQDGLMLIQAYAGGAGMGVYQAAESMPEGYYALGAADGQFQLSDRIIASQVKSGGQIFYEGIEDFAAGKLPSGIYYIGVEDGTLSLTVAPGKESLVPQEITDRIEELKQKVISGEIVPPSNEEEYNAFGQ